MATTKIHGLKELSRALKKLPRDVRGKTLDKAAREGSKVIRDRAKDYAPAGETGNLKASIVTRKDRQQSSTENSVYTVGYLKKKAYYGGFVELGTSRMPAQSFLRTGIDTSQRQAVDKTAAVLKRALKL